MEDKQSIGVDAVGLYTEGVGGELITQPVKSRRFEIALGNRENDRVSS